MDSDSDSESEPRLRNQRKKLQILKTEVLKRSQGKVWKMATREWELQYLYDDATCTGVCLCTHSPIREHCVYKNIHTKEEITIGNVCALHFDCDEADIGGTNTPAFFAGMKRIKTEPTKRINKAVIDALEQKKKLFQSEIDLVRLYGRKAVSADEQKCLDLVRRKAAAAFTQNPQVLLKLGIYTFDMFKDDVLPIRSFVQKFLKGRVVTRDLLEFCTQRQILNNYELKFCNGHCFNPPYYTYTEKQTEFMKVVNAKIIKALK